jgi:hypothetical protein
MLRILLLFSLKAYRLKNKLVLFFFGLKNAEMFLESFFLSAVLMLYLIYSFW